MDGLSKDGTLSVAQSFNDERIKIYSEADGGIYYAMNKGIHKASGEWLFFLGSDDTLFSENVLNDIYKAIGAIDVDIIYGNVISDRFGGFYGGEFNRTRILESNICHQSIFYKKDIFKKTGVFNTVYPLNADWDHNLKWIFSDKIKNKFVNITVANYADGGLSSTTLDTNFNSEWTIRQIIYGEIKLPFKKKIGLIKYYVQKAVKKQNGIRLNYLLSNLLKILIS